MKVTSNLTSLTLAALMALAIPLHAQEEDLAGQLMPSSAPAKSSPTLITAEEIVKKLEPTRSTKMTKRTTLMSREAYDELKAQGKDATRGIEIVAVDASTVQATVTVTEQQIAFSNLRFKLDSVELADEASRKQLVEIVKALRELGAKHSFLIEGHTCDLGTDEHNQTLSERRATAVSQFLKQQGVECQFVSVGFGETDPSTANTSEENREENRRVVVRLKS